MDIALGIVGIIATVMLGVVAYRQNIFGQRLAERELREKSSFILSVNRSDAEQVVWMLPWDENKKTYITDLEIAIHNTGTKTLNDIYVVLEVSSLLYSPELPRHESANSRLVKMARVVDPIDGTERSQVTYSFESINPNIRVLVTDNITLMGSSRFKTDVPATTADGVDVIVTWETVIGYGLSLTVTGRDIPPYRRNIDILSFDFKDPIVAKMADPSGALSWITQNLSAIDQAKTTRMFFGDAPEYAPEDFPIEIRDMVARVRLKGSRYVDCTFYPDIGFLPLGPAAEGSASKRSKRS